MVGKTISHYRILAKLGGGGMGEVYVAHDPSLNRRIALKTLPAILAADPERRQRFEREAQAVAALTHPNIVTIYSVEHADGVHFITMELVEGKTLGELVPRDGLPLETILKYGIPLADAIGAAHQRGITHRDLKPANVMVTHDGRLKVLDFGLAKLAKDTDPIAQGITGLATEDLTGEGRILGTVAYMSPEQAEGKSADHRSDIFSLGVILYEAATGERPFKGDSPTSVLSSILRDTPKPVTDVRRSLPRDFWRIVRRCLAKDAEERYQTAKDLRNDLTELKHELDSGELAAGGVAHAPLPTRSRFGSYALAGAAAGVILVVGFVAYRLVRPAERASDAAPAATFMQLTAQPGLEQFPSISPDGKWIVYTSDARGKEDIYLQSIGGRTPINLTESSDAANWAPVFSPDGDRIAFRSERAGGGIFVMGRTGESPTRVSNVGFTPAWSPDASEIAYSTQNSDHPFTRSTVGELWAVKVTTGERRRLTQSDAVQPSWSPHGGRIAYWAVPDNGGQRDIWTVAARGGAPVRVTNDPAVDWSPTWSPDGRHLYFSSDRSGSMNLWRVAIDEETGQVLGSPQPVTTPAPFAAHVRFSADGHRLVYTALVVQSNIAVVDFDPAAGKVVGQPRSVTQGTRFWWAPEPSPDGQWVAFNAFSPEDVYVSRSDGRDLRQLTHDFVTARNPHWSPDGSTITFYSSRSGTYNIWKLSPDGSALQQLTFADYALFDGTWSPDGSHMFVADSRTGRARGLIFDPNRPWKDQTPRVLSTPPGLALRAAVWSPDGSKLAGTGGIPLWISALNSAQFDRLPLPPSPSRNSRTILAPGTAPPSWMNDSVRVISALDGKLFLTNTQTRQTEQLLALSGEAANYPSLSRDNRQLYFTRGSVTGDIWMATLR